MRSCRYLLAQSLKRSRAAVRALVDTTDGRRWRTRFWLMLLASTAVLLVLTLFLATPPEQEGSDNTLVQEFTRWRQKRAAKDVKMRISRQGEAVTRFRIPMANIPIVVLVRGDDEASLRRSLSSLKERTSNYIANIILSPIYGSDEHLLSILREFPFKILEHSSSTNLFSNRLFSMFETLSAPFERKRVQAQLREMFSDCTGVEKVRTTFRYLNRHVNISKLVTFTPKLFERQDEHELFTAFHNNIYNSNYQMCFKNSLEYFAGKNIPLTGRDLVDYFLKEENLEIISPEHGFSSPKSSESELEDEVMRIFEDRKEQCEVFQRLKDTLSHLLLQNPLAKRFIVTDDRHLFATDFESFFWQIQDAFERDPSVYCASLGNPLFPATFPKFVLEPNSAESAFLNETSASDASNLGTNHTTEDGAEGRFNDERKLEREQNSDARSTKPVAKTKVPKDLTYKNTPEPVFSTITKETELRRVSHFLFYGATMVNRNLLQEIIENFALPPYPSTRASPRPSDFATLNLADEMNGTVIPGITSGEKYTNPVKSPPRHMTKRRGVSHYFDIMSTLRDWLSWSSNRLLRDCIHPTLPRTCRISDTLNYKSHPLASRKFPAPSPLGSQRRSDPPFSGEGSQLSSYVTWKSIEQVASNDELEAAFYDENFRIDFENCLRKGTTEVELMDQTRLVRYRYYQEVFADMLRATPLGTVAGSNCSSRDFYPDTYGMGGTYLLLFKMISFADDYTLFKVLECMGIVRARGGIASSLAAGQFDGVYQLQLRDGSLLYVMAVPLARLTPEISVDQLQVVAARPGTSYGVLVVPMSEYEGAEFEWRPVEVMRTEDFVSPLNMTEA